MKRRSIFYLVDMVVVAVDIQKGVVLLAALDSWVPNHTFQAMPLVGNSSATLEDRSDTVAAAADTVAAAADTVAVLADTVAAPGGYPGGGVWP